MEINTIGSVTGFDDLPRSICRTHYELLSVDRTLWPQWVGHAFAARRPQCVGRVASAAIRRPRVVATRPTLYRPLVSQDDWAKSNVRYIAKCNANCKRIELMLHRIFNFLFLLNFSGLFRV